MSAVQLIAGMSWKAVVAAEVLSIPKYSLGYEMMNSKYYLQTPVLFAYILVIVVLSLAMEKIIGLLMGRSVPSGYEGSRLIPMYMEDAPMKAAELLPLFFRA